MNAGIVEEPVFILSEVVSVAFCVNIHLILSMFLRT